MQDSTKCFGHSSVSFREMTDLSRPVSTLGATANHCTTGLKGGVRFFLTEERPQKNDDSSNSLKKNTALGLVRQLRSKAL